MTDGRPFSQPPIPNKGNPLDPPPKQKASAERPTIGRIVHVALSPAHGPAGGPWMNAAIVTGVNADGTVDLMVFPPRGTSPLPVLNVEHESVAIGVQAAWRWPFRS